MNISCSTRWAEALSTKLALATLADAGFSYADAWVVDAAAARTWVDEVKSSPVQIARLHLQEVSTPEQVREMIQLAAQLGLRSLIVSAGPRRLESMQYFVQTLELVVAGMPGDFVIELANRNGSRLEQLEDFRALFVLTHHARLAVTIDAVEFQRASVNPRDAIREWGERMGRLIIGDMIGDRRVPLGDGEVNVRAVIEHVRRIGYNGGYVLDPCVADASRPHDDLIRERERLTAMLDA